MRWHAPLTRSPLARRSCSRPCSLQQHNELGACKRRQRGRALTTTLGFPSGADTTENGQCFMSSCTLLSLKRRPMRRLASNTVFCSSVTSRALASARKQAAISISGARTFGFSATWFLAASPMSRSVSVKATSARMRHQHKAAQSKREDAHEGVVRLPCSLATISTRSCCHTPTQLREERRGRSVRQSPMHRCPPQCGSQCSGRHLTPVRGPFAHAHSRTSQPRARKGCARALPSRAVATPRADAPRSMPMAMSLLMLRAAMLCTGERAAERAEKVRPRKLQASLAASSARPHPASLLSHFRLPAGSVLAPGRRSVCAMGLDGEQPCASPHVHPRCSLHAGADDFVPRRRHHRVTQRRSARPVVGGCQRRRQQIDTRRAGWLRLHAEAREGGRTLRSRYVCALRHLFAESCSFVLRRSTLTRRRRRRMDDLRAFRRAAPRC